MADSAVVVTAGTGTNIDTRTEATNGHHRQVVVLGDPATNAGVAPVDATAGLKVDLGADNDITGTVTANLGATDNAVLDAIEADTTTIAGAVAGTEMQVDIVSAPTLTVNSHAVTNAGTFATQVDGAALTSLQLADDVVATLGTTTYTEAASKGTLIGAVRRDADTTLVDTTNEVAPLQVDAAGRLKVEIFDGGDAHTVDGTVTANAGTGTFTVDGSGVTQPVSNAGLTELAAAINSSKVDVNIVSSDVATGGTSALDDADFVAGTTPGTPAMGVYDSTPDTVTDGDLGTIGINSTRAVRTVIEAGSAAIGKLAANSGVDIGDVDVTSSALPTGASTSAKQDTGNTSLATLAGAVAGTEMQVDVLTMPTVTVTATNLDVQSGGADLATTTQAGAIQTATELIDDVIYVDDADWTDSTSKHALVGGLYQSTPQTVTDGDVAPFNITANGALHVSDAGGSLTVDGTVTANLSATDNTVLDNIDADTSAIQTAVELLDNAVDGNYLNVNMNVAGTDVVSGSGTATGALRVELPTNGTGVIATVGAVTAITNALPAGTNAIGKLSANSGVDIGDVDVASVVPGTAATNLGKAEDAGHTSGDVGVFNLGVRVDSPNVALTNTDADYSPITTNKLGSLRTAALEDDLATAATTHTYKYYTNAGAVTDGIIWSPAAGKRWFLTSLTINVSAAATVTIEDDVAAGDVVRFKFEFAANSGITIPFPEVPMFSGEDAADLLVTTSAGNVYITCVGYEI